MSLAAWAFWAIVIVVGSAGVLYLLVEDRPYRLRDESDFDITDLMVWRGRKS